jgi:hypothetical protein
VHPAEALGGVLVVVARPVAHLAVRLIAKALLTPVRLPFLMLREVFLGFLMSS